jgi:hypothetical protein
MFRFVAAFAAATSCVAIAHAQEVGTESRQISGPILTLEDALALAVGAAPPRTLRQRTSMRQARRAASRGCDPIPHLP